jgi:hypothetical protein
MVKIEYKEGLGKRRLLFVIAAVLVLSLATISIITLRPLMTGLATGEETYTDKINIVAEQYTEYEWQPSEKGQIISLMASGELLGDGSAKVYIENNGERYLIYDSEQSKSIKNVLTGLTLEPTPDESDGESESSDSADSSPSETPSEDAPEEPAAEETPLEPPAEEPQPEETPIEPPEEQPQPSEGNETIINETIEENVTEEINITENAPEENISEKIKFDEICIETCTLEDFNQSSYKIIIEADDGTVLKLKTLTYTIKAGLEEVNLTEMNLTNVSEVNYEMIQEDSKIDAVIDSIEYNNETQTLNVVFHHESNKMEPITIISEDLIDYTLDKDMSMKNENVTLIVDNWDPSQYFEIKVGQHSQIIGIGDVPEYDFDATVEDADGKAINATVEFVKPVSKDIKEEMTGTENVKKIKKGQYDIVVKPGEDNAVQEIEFHDININQSTDEFIKIDDVNETEKNLTQYVEVYAIDPTQFNFTNATVTVTAKGSELYKCKDWNFTEQTCYGEWTKLMDITPGENYTFTLTPEDPAFGEIYITKAEHLDSSKNFISDIYDAVKALDDVWSEAISDGEYVRVTFEKNLTSENDITLYPRIVNGTPTIEVYEKDGSEIVTAFTDVNNDEYNKVYLTSLSGEQDTFDLLILNGSVEFDHIIDPALGTPNDGLSFFLSSAGTMASDAGSYQDDFNECPIQLNDYGQTSEKCTLWDCTAWTAGATADFGYYCSGGWNCTDWNGVTCAKYACNTWTKATNDRRAEYCAGGWNCTNWQGSYCQRWACLSYLEGTVDGYDKYCSGGWNCSSFNGATCGLWNCNSWSDGSALAKSDFYCISGWNCSSWNGNSCSNWSCATWNYGTAKFDVYCGGTWDCTVWNGNVCGNWACTSMTTTGTLGKDNYCDRWNCSSWDADKKVCDGWTCLQWISSGTTDINYYCSGVWNCTTWNALSYPAPTISIISPTATTYNNRTQLVNISAPGAASIWYKWNGTNYTYTVPIYTTFAEGPNTLDAWANATTGETSATSVTFTTDTTPPASVTSLTSPSKGTTWIYWTWTNPVSDFSEAIVYLDGTWKVNTSNNYYNATSLNSNTDYTITIRTKDAVGNVNMTNVSSTVKTLVSCTENWIVQYGSCLVNDTKLKYYTDQNNCGTTINLPGDNGTYVECNYCTSAWENVNGSCRTNDTFVVGYHYTDTCCAQTGLPSDCNIPSNTTDVCNYCSYNVTTTDWSEWQNETECRVNDTQLQNRSRIEYDDHHATCYLVTLLSSDLWNNGNNNTYWEYRDIGCDYCTPDLVYTDWSGWYNVTSCRVNDTLMQERNRTLYDTKNCGEVENQTFYEQQDAMCDYNGAPVITIYSPFDEETYTYSDINLNVSANEAVQKWWYKLNGGTNITFTPNTTITGIETSNTLKVYANDSFGNIGYKQISFTIDTTPPSSVTGLSDQSSGKTWIYWTWLNPEDPDFDKAIVYIDDEWKINTSDGHYNATGFGCEESHNITVHTRDIYGWVNETDIDDDADTLPCARGVEMTDPADKETNRTVNATYIITITNTGEIADTYTLSIDNIDGASTAELNESSLAIGIGQSKNITLDVTDDDTLGQYVVNVTATSDSDPGASAEISIATEVLGILGTDFIEPSGNPTYYEGLNVTLQGYVHDEMDNAVSGADISFELIYDTYNYECTNITDIGGGYYNCTLSTYGMQTPHYYNVRINASKTGYHNGTSTETSAFLLENNQEANLTLQKSATLALLNDTTVVYDISNKLTNAKGTSQSTNLTDPHAQTWQLGDLGAESVYRNYTLSYDRGQSNLTIMLDKSTAEGYDPIYGAELYAESNQPTIFVPETAEAIGLTLIKSTDYSSQTNTTMTYDLSLYIINSGNRDLTDIPIVDADLGLSEDIDIKMGAIWQAEGNKTIDKNPQSYDYTFAKASAYANSTYFYSNQPVENIPGYGGPYDVVIITLPNSALPESQITGAVKVINQNTEVEDDRVLTTWIEDANGTIYDIDLRTVFIAKNQSITEQVSLTAPAIEGTYYFVSELTWPTAEANASSSFIVKKKSGGAGGLGGGGGGTGTPGIENTTTAPTNRTITAPSIPEDIVQDIITLMNSDREIKERLERSKAQGADVANSEELLGELEALIDEIEEKAAKGEYDFARNLIENAFNKVKIMLAIEGYEISGGVITPSGETFRAPSAQEFKQSLRFIGLFAFIVLISIVVVLGMIRKRRAQEKELKKFVSSQGRHLSKFEKEINAKLRKANTKQKQETEIKTFVKAQEKSFDKFEREINDKLGKIDLK